MKKPQIYFSNEWNRTKKYKIYADGIWFHGLDNIRIYLFDFHERVIFVRLSVY
jgi:hypothetical protein